jgi:methyl-accepting chemotaxis protein
MFKSMTVGKKIGAGFGVVLILLGLINAITFFSVGSIVKNAFNMISGQKIISDVKQFEIDQLNWLSKVSEYMTSDLVEDLDVEKNYLKSDFGVFLYGEGRKNAEKIVPQLAPLFNQLEAPLKMVYDSAVDIEKKMNKLNTNYMTNFFYRIDIDHKDWVQNVLAEIYNLDGSNMDVKNLTVETDHKKCGLGKWLYEGEAEELAKQYPAFSGLIEELKLPHQHMHEAAIEINNRLAMSDFDGAIVLVREKIRPSSGKTAMALQNIRNLVMELEGAKMEATEIYTNVTQNNIIQIQDIFHQFRDIVEKNMITQDELLNSAGRLKYIITAIGLTATVFGLLIAFLIVRELVTSLTGIAKNINEGTEQVANAAGQLSSTSHILSEGAGDQAASLEETTSSLEEMSTMTKQNAEHAIEADNLMKEANLMVSRANETMFQLSTSMDDISKASQETHKVVKTIDEIAFQTNLLALNAAVEAARAGDAGAGFAVVAEEVRNLALRSADAAKNTAQLIEGTVNKVKDGSVLVRKTSDAFAEVASGSSKVGELVEEIAAASNEQARGVEQINTTMAQIDKITQQNAANAEESAASSEELSAQSQQMKHVVDKLLAKVGGNKNKNVKSKHVSLSVKKSFGVKKAKNNDNPKQNEKAHMLVHKTENNNSKNIITPSDLFAPLDDDDFNKF